MGRFDRYMLSQLMVVFGFSALVLILVYWVNRAVILFDQLISDGQSAWVFLEFTALALPAIIRIVLPLAAFGAALWVTNRLTTESELTAIRAAGVSPLRLARAPLVFGLTVAALVAALTHALVPAAAGRLALRQTEVAATATARLLREGEFLNPARGVTLYIRNLTEAGEIEDFFLEDARDPDQTLTYTARRAYLVRATADRAAQIVLVDGLAQRLFLADQRLATTAFDTLAYDVGALLPPPAAPRVTTRSLTTGQLLVPSEATLTATGKSREVLWAEGQARLAEPLLAAVAALLGYSALVAGGFSRFGVWKQVIGAIFLVIVIKAVETVAAAAIASRPQVWALVWLPGLVGLALCLALLLRASGSGRIARVPRAAA